jgi:hypothetical protein
MRVLNASRGGRFAQIRHAAASRTLSHGDVMRSPNHCFERPAVADYRYRVSYDKNRDENLMMHAAG